LVFHQQQSFKAKVLGGVKDLGAYFHLQRLVNAIYIVLKPGGWRPVCRRRTGAAGSLSIWIIPL